MAGRYTAEERAGFKRNQPEAKQARRQATASAAAPATPAAPASTLPGGVAPAATVTAQMDPTLSRQLTHYEDRLSANPQARAIQDSTLGISDAAALSAADAKGIMARRGTRGTGAGDTYLRKHVFDPAQRQAAGAAAQIAGQRQQDLDRLVLGGTSLAAAPGQQSIQERNLALNTQGQAFNQSFSTSQDQWNREFQAEEAQRRADEEAARQMAALYQPYLNGTTVPPGIPIPGVGTTNQPRPGTVGGSLDYAGGSRSSLGAHFA